MKKIAVTLAAGILCCMSTLPVMADNAIITKPGTQDTKLTYSVDEDYMVMIPESVSLNQTVSITSKHANTEPGKAVKVRISSGLEDGKVSLTRDYDTDNYMIKASVSSGGTTQTVDSNTVVASFSEVFVEEGKDPVVGGTLTFGEPQSADGSEIKAGTYTGSMTFSISYENQ